MTMSGVGGSDARAMTRDEWIEYQRIQRIRRLRDQYGLINNDQMRALSTKGMHAWLLQGPQLVRTGLLVDDIFFKISSYLLNLPTQETKDIFSAVHIKLFNDVVSRIDRKNTGCFSFFKSKKKANAKRQEAIDRYENRRLLSM